MGLDLRPVIEKWGPHYSYQLGHEEMVELLAEIAGRADTACITESYGDLERVWIEDGKRFLDLLAGGKEAMLDAKAKGLDAYDLTDAELEIVNELAGLVEQWRAWIDADDGALRIYVD